MNENLVAIPRKIESNGTGGPDHFSICDAQFIDDVTRLKALRSYLIKQAKSTHAGLPDLGDLNFLRFEKKVEPRLMMSVFN